jgi:hypothetical protein
MAEPEEDAVVGAADPDGTRAAFEREAVRAARRSGGPLGEFRYFLARTRKWWMAPIVAALLVIGTLLVMSSSAVAPLIYALF